MFNIEEIMTQIRSAKKVPDNKESVASKGAPSDLIYAKDVDFKGVKGFFRKFVARYCEFLFYPLFQQLNAVHRDLYQHTDEVRHEIRYEIDRKIEVTRYGLLSQLDQQQRKIVLLESRIDYLEEENVELQRICATNEKTGKKKRRKIAFVVQRYGLEVNGGAELHCRFLAEHMLDRYEVHVITTKAVDYQTWEDSYPCDEEVINGVIVHRFSVDHPREMKSFIELSEQIVKEEERSKEREEEWMDAQGPLSGTLISYLEEKKNSYDVFIFFTYLYCTTYYGLQRVGDKAILIPTAHDEWPIYFGIFDAMFHQPQGIFYNTRLEKEFIDKKFHVEDTLNNRGLGGVGVEVSGNVSEESIDAFKKQYDLEHFMLYVGRIEESKGCRELFTFFDRYQSENRNDMKLVLMGKPVMEIPENPDIISLGFVQEEEKYAIIASCDFLVLPSQFESLSMVVLEAMMMKRPVLVHGNCEVVKEHCILSNGGLYYIDYEDFAGCIDYFLNHPEEAALMGRRGAEYVKQYYQWNVITDRLSRMIEQVAK